MSKHLESVKDSADFLRSKIDMASTDKGASELSKRVAALDDAYDHFKSLEALTQPLNPELGDLSDLPSELVEELNVAKADELENQIFTVMSAFGGTATLDQILVGLFRKFKVVQKRRFLQGKLYRMSKSELIWSVPDRKGAYSTSKPENFPELKSKKTDDFETHEPDFSEDMEDEIPF